MRFLLFLLGLCLAHGLLAQDAQKDSLSTASEYYKLGLEYKDGIGAKMNYTKAVAYFTIAANMGDPQSVYALAYMHYKGLGCLQDYTKAAELFALGANSGKDNSMYFYGLCWRNGYGVAKNADSAKFWLQKSADLGYKQALWELAMPNGENSNDSAITLLKSVSNAAIPVRVQLNQYIKIESHIPAAEIVTGYYRGYIVQYDWSGQHVVTAKPLTLNLQGKSNRLVGVWSERGSDSFDIKASISADSLKFDKSRYKRTDHYSPDSAIRYDLQNACLNLVRKGDSIFLAGNVNMFSPDRKEPSKPLFIALYRIATIAPDKITDVSVAPNPFVSSLKVQFTISETTSATIQLLTTTGTVIYEQKSGMLSPGHYLFQLQPGFIAQGSYIVRVKYGNASKIVKVIRS